MTSRAGAGELRSAVVQPKTSNKYKQYLHYFFDFCRECGIQPPSDPTLMDTLMSEYMEWLYQSDYALSSATCAFYGLLHFYPQFKHFLPESDMALRGWSKLHPGRSYPPLTWNLTCLIALQLAQSGDPTAAMAVLLSFDCYLRITECINLTVADVAVPGDRRLGVQHQWVALSLRQTKTGPNQWVQLRRPEVGALLCRFLAARVRLPTDRLFPVTAVTQREAFHKACTCRVIRVFHC